jgi:hypothetical protein
MRRWIIEEAGHVCAKILLTDYYIHHNNPPTQISTTLTRKHHYSDADIEPQRNSASHRKTASERPNEEGGLQILCEKDSIEYIPPHPTRPQNNLLT